MRLLSQVGGFSGVVALIFGPVMAGHGDAPRCRREPALTEVAVRWSLGELAREGLVVTPATLREAAQRAGSDRVFIRGALVQSDEDRTMLFSRFDGDVPLVCGEAVGASGTVLVVSEVAGTLIVKGSDARFRLESGYRDPHLAVRTEHRRFRLAPTDDGVFDLGGIEPPAVLQLMATGPNGPTPVARRLLGDEFPTALGPATDDPQASLQAARRQAGAPRLRRNRVLSEVAEAHAADLCGHHTIHHGAAGAGPTERVRAAGLQARLVGEVAGRASSVAAAMDALMRSPSHELTMLDARMTDVGVGESEDVQGHHCLVVLFAAWPRASVR